MKSGGLKITFFRGVALAVPVAVVAYVFIRILDIFKTMLGPVAEKMGIQKLFGELTLTIFALLLILLIILVLGLLMQLSTVAKLRTLLEDTLLKFIPSLNHLKVMMADKVDIGNEQHNWKPVLLFFEQKYNAAFIVEEDGEFITLFVIKTTSLKEGEIVTASKKDLSIIPATYDELHQYSRAFGKGFLSMIKSENYKQGS